MKIEEFVHKGVKPNGTFENELGAIHTDARVIVMRGEGCGISACHCSDGYSLSVCLPRNPKTKEVRGIIVRFADANEMRKVLGEVKG
jgi:hypothetical protein